MGADIHVYVERRHPTKGWVPAKPPRKANQPSRDDPDYYAKIDWSDWGRWNDPEPDLKLLADQALPFEDRIPAGDIDWAFGRNYEAFGELAGVRCPELGPPIQPRHVPDDVSDAVFEQGVTDSDRWNSRRFERGGTTYYWLPDWHTPHWYSLAEMIQFCRDGFFAVGRIRELRDEMKKIAKLYKLGTEDVRTVFWFDN